MSILLLVLQAQGPETVIGGGAGWLGAGLFGLVLGWLLLVHLPAKDKQITGLFDLFRQERELDRLNRQEGAKFFREAMQTVIENYLQNTKSERESFEKRIQRLEEAMKTVCGYNKINPPIDSEK
jgi:hypothetical protein